MELKASASIINWGFRGSDQRIIIKLPHGSFHINGKTSEALLEFLEKARLLSRDDPGVGEFFKKIDQLMIIDETTKLFNKIYLENLLVRCFNNISAAKKKGEEKNFFLVFIDIEGFKWSDIEKRDQVFKDVAETIRENVKSRDTIGRFEENIFYILGCGSASSGQRIAKRIEKKLKLENGLKVFIGVASTERYSNLIKPDLSEKIVKRFGLDLIDKAKIMLTLNRQRRTHGKQMASRNKICFSS